MRPIKSKTSRAEVLKTLKPAITAQKYLMASWVISLLLFICAVVLSLNGFRLLSDITKALYTISSIVMLISGIVMSYKLSGIGLGIIFFLLGWIPVFSLIIIVFLNRIATNKFKLLGLSVGFLGVRNEIYDNRLKELEEKITGGNKLTELNIKT